MKTIGVSFYQRRTPMFYFGVIFLFCSVLLPFNSEQVFAVNNPPQINSITANPSTIYYATTTVITAEVYDLDGDTLTYTWTKSTGTISGDKDTDPQIVTYTAPNFYSGKVNITLAVYDLHNPTVTASTSIQVVIAQYSTQITQGLIAPTRIATDPYGNIYVTDGRKRQVLVYKPLPLPAELKLMIADLSAPVGIAADEKGNIYIADEKEKTVYLYNSSGKRIKNFGEFTRPCDLAIDNKSGKLFVTDSGANLVKVYDLEGSFIYSFDGCGKLIDKSGNIYNYEAKFNYPTGIAIDEKNHIVLVANTKGECSNTLPDGTKLTTYRYKIQKFDLDGYWLGEFGNSGAGYKIPTAGRFVLLQGLSLDNLGCIYTVDTVWAKIQAFDPQNKPFTGSPFFADLGDGAGYLYTPTDVVVDCFRRLLVTNTQNGRIEIYNLKDAQPPRIITPEAAPAVRRPPATDFRLREYYVFPNPAKRGKAPTIHLECGIADRVEIRIYNVAAELVHSVTLGGQGEGGYLGYDWCLNPNLKETKWEWAYEYPWDVSHIASGVYIGHIRASKAGYPDIKVLYKFSVIK